GDTKRRLVTSESLLHVFETLPTVLHFEPVPNTVPTLLRMCRARIEHFAHFSTYCCAKVQWLSKRLEYLHFLCALSLLTNRSEHSDKREEVVFNIFDGFPLTLEAGNCFVQ